MKERPILFSGEMVLAILEGRKTQTRRVLKKQPEKSTWEGLDGYRFDVRFFDDVICGTTRKHSCGVRFANRLHQRQDCALWVPCPYGQPGDRLWVKETFSAERLGGSPGNPHYGAKGSGVCINYLADDYSCNFNEPDWCDFFKHEKTMPSIFMPRWASRITLEIVSVRVERLHAITIEDAKAEGVETTDQYAELWAKINGWESWDANPWVWVIEFKKIAQ